ncbi:MAG TPA: guanylate kinase [Pyrinomonadaceae bacterium]|nr:guanylate kinase [Pyrinomonadaceae bacterium]
MKGNLFIITSPSGGGKGTLIREVLRTVPKVGYSVSFTTRRQRVGEEHGKHYYFVSREEFEKKAAEGEFLEWANVHGNLYGTSRAQVDSELNLGRDIILEIDVQGAEIVKKLAPKAVGVFILPPSFEVLRERLTARRTEAAADLQIRLQNSKSEVGRWKEFDYVIINDEITSASQDLAAVFLAERLKRGRQSGNIEKIIKTFENL